MNRGAAARARAAALLRRLGPRAAGGPLLSRWRRSLSLRVVATTMLLGLAVVAGVGTLVFGRIREGLVQDRLTAALGEARRGQVEAEARFNTVTDTLGLNLLLTDLVRALASPQPDRSREVVLLRAAADATSSTTAPALSSPALSSTVIPQVLRDRVERTGRRESQFIRITYDDGAPSVPGIAVGSRLTLPVGGAYELYFVFSLEREQATLDLVRRTLLIGGALLVLLVGALAFVVTRQVVAPVRQASLVAQRLASGRLHERMRARGEDDLARLAASFNAMAISLQNQIRQLEHLSRVQQRFVSDVSHELRTPLTTVRMAADVLHDARADFDPLAARSAELLQTQLDRFEVLLADLLEISRIDAGGAVLEREPVDLRDLAARVVEAAVPLSAAGETLQLVVSERECVAEVDPRRIDRILRNLVVNALEHGNGRPIDVSVAGDDHAVAVSVRDHGVGLKPGESALVFNRFWRGDPSRARTLGGTGLGLAIAGEDARLHGGWLQAWGEPGQGSCFRLTLPRRADLELTSSPLPLGPTADDELVVGGPYLRIAARAGDELPPASAWAVRRG